MKAKKIDPPGNFPLIQNERSELGPDLAYRFGQITKPGSPAG